MVTVDYTGRTGNHLFQYTMARLVADFNRQPMSSPMPTNDFIQPNPQEIIDYFAPNQIVRITDDTKPIPDIDLCGQRAHLHGFFQKAYYYNKYRDHIRGYWNLKPIENINFKDIVIHFRLTDYFLPQFKCVISPTWYFDILMREKFEKLYIVVEPHPTNEKYLGYFKHYKPIIVSKSPSEDFNFIRSFDKIVCSNSTFCWWAAFLSYARKIYTFKPWMGIIRGAVPDLAGIEGATQIDGRFYRDHQLELYNWKEYWKK